MADGGGGSHVVSQSSTGVGSPSGPLRALGRGVCSAAGCFARGLPAAAVGVGCAAVLAAVAAEAAAALAAHRGKYRGEEQREPRKEIQGEYGGSGGGRGARVGCIYDKDEEEDDGGGGAARKWKWW